MKVAWSRKNLWERAPSAVRTLVGLFASALPPQYLLGRTFRRNLGFVRDAEWWSADRYHTYQLNEVRNICTLAYEKSRYYRRAFRRIGFTPADLKSLDDFVNLPTINKDIVQENLEQMCVVPADSPGVDCVATGGSSGTPLRFYIGSGRSAIEYAYLVASWERAGYRLSMPQVVLRGQIVEPNRSGLRHQYDRLLKRHYYSNFHMTEDDMRRYLEHMRSIGPFYLHAYPSSVDVLARFIEKDGAAPPEHLRGILAGSENVRTPDRTFAERVLQVRYFSWYGHSEKLVLAAECEHSSDYHVWPTYGYCELLDESGSPVVNPGQRGEIVGTGFINRVVPFIRYRTGDYAVFGGTRCEACGREQMILKQIEGRWPAGNLVAVDGSLISMTALNVHDDTFANVLDYQFVQDKPGEAVLCVVPGRGFSEEERTRVVSRINARLQGRVMLTLRSCSELQKTERGKKPLVIQKETAPAMLGDGP